MYETLVLTDVGCRSVWEHGKKVGYCVNLMINTKAYSLEKLKEYASRVVYVHGKFYDIDAEGQVDNIDYPKVMKALQDGGYKGYICSEFEGNRRMNDAGWVDEIEYVRMHQVLMRKCLGYGDGAV